MMSGQRVGIDYGSVLRDLVGNDSVYETGDSDAVDEVKPLYVVEPSTVEEAAEVLKLASRESLTVLPRGGGTKLGWGNPPERADLVLSTARLDRVLEHASGDLVVSVQAGVTLEQLQPELALTGQQLALDPPHSGATLGGIIATNASGPMRLRYGTVRDLLIGITVLLTDGTIARAGGKVVKNVAGYDLMKLFTGSLGTLGLILEARFRLHPVAEASGTLVIDVRSPEAAGAATQVLMHSTLVPSAMELFWPSQGEGGVLALRFEGVTLGVEEQLESARACVMGHGAARVLSGDEETRFWTGTAPGSMRGDDVLVKVATLPSELSRVLEHVFALSERGGVQAVLRGHAAIGVTYVALSGGDGIAMANVVVALREELSRTGGSLVVLEAPTWLKRSVDVWGPVGNDLPLMRRVKARFDPNRVLSPGRFVGGI